MHVRWFGSLSMVRVPTTPEIDAVILDLTMPRMGGSEALERNRGIVPGIPALLISGFTEREIPNPGPDTPFLQKPFRLHELVERVEDLIHHREA